MIGAEKPKPSDLVGD